MEALQFDQIMGTLVYSVIGIAVFAVAFYVIVKIAPFSVRKEIAQDQNVALGILIGAVIIGLSIIISAAIR